MDESIDLVESFLIGLYSHKFVQFMLVFKTGLCVPFNTPVPPGVKWRMVATEACRSLSSAIEAFDNHGKTREKSLCCILAILA